MGISDLCYNKMINELYKRKFNNEISKPEKDTPIEKEQGELMNFAVFGDPQVSNYMFARECCFYSATRDFCNIKDELDALVIVGDITENGMKCEWRAVAHILNSVSDKVANFFFAVGNHDIRLRPYSLQKNKFVEFTKSVKNSHTPDTGKYWHSYNFPHCKFIIMGADKNSFEAAHISKKQLKFLNSEIEKAEKENKPAFVFNHQPLKKTHGLPNTWMSKDTWRGSVGRQSDKVKKIFENHSNVVYITGHLHMGANQQSFEDKGKYKCFSIPTVGASNHGTNGKVSQGYVFSVFSDRIKAKARYFGEGKYIDSTQVTIPLK